MVRNFHSMSTNTFNPEKTCVMHVLEPLSIQVTNKRQSVMEIEIRTNTIIIKGGAACFLCIRCQDKKAIATNSVLWYDLRGTN